MGLVKGKLVKPPKFDLITTLETCQVLIHNTGSLRNNAHALGVQNGYLS